MNNDISEIINNERVRLNDIGLPFLHIHCTDGVPVAILDYNILMNVIDQRNMGDELPGYFIAEKDGYWAASFIGKDGVHHSRKNLTECKAYRWLLGYPIGRSTRTRWKSRF